MTRANFFIDLFNLPWITSVVRLTWSQYVNLHNVTYMLGPLREEPWPVHTSRAVAHITSFLLCWFLILWAVICISISWTQTFHWPRAETLPTCNWTLHRKGINSLTFPFKLTVSSISQTSQFKYPLNIFCFYILLTFVFVYISVKWSFSLQWTETTVIWERGAQVNIWTIWSQTFFTTLFANLMATKTFLLPLFLIMCH
jgi:hypothetical protein